MMDCLDQHVAFFSGGGGGEIGQLQVYATIIELTGFLSNPNLHLCALTIMSIVRIR